uniref:Spaetzle domain-containing protein n=1 Tax=Anopheles epiroticus TaxID=199890 RepID=A0A182PV05_9DIPT
MAGVQQLHANPQSFVPLARLRAIRDDDENRNIESIFRKDFKTSPAPKDGRNEEVEPSPTELVARAYPGGGSARPRQPVDKNEKNAMVYVVRDAEGKLVPKFADVRYTTPRPTPPAKEEPTAGSDGMILLKIADEQNENQELEFDEASYPANYPREAIERILRNHQPRYEDVFDRTIQREPLATRVDSEGDKYLCNSILHTEYPAVVENYTIVNYNRFYQRITYETCSHVNSICSNSFTADGYQLVCQQTYRYHKLFTVQPNAEKFTQVELKFPSCCKCAHVKLG